MIVVGLEEKSQDGGQEKGEVGRGGSGSGRGALAIDITSGDVSGQTSSINRSRTNRRCASRARGGAVLKGDFALGDRPHGSLAVSTLARLLVLCHVPQADALIQGDHAVSVGLYDVDDAAGDVHGVADGVALHRDKVARAGGLEGHGQLEGVVDAVGIAGVVVGLHVVLGDDQAGALNGAHDAVVPALVRQADELWVITDKVAHDVGGAGDGGLDLVIAHLEQVPRGVRADTDQMATRRNALDHGLHVGVRQVLRGQVEGDVRVLLLQDVQQLAGVLGGAVVERHGEHAGALALVDDLGGGHGGRKQREEEELHCSLCLLCFVNAKEGGDVEVAVAKGCRQAASYL